MNIKKINEKDIKMIIADIDGTLTPRGRMLTERTVQMIKRLKDHGIEFVLASGRPLDELDCLIDNWKCPHDLFAFHIGMNGGQLKDLHDGKSDEFFKLDPKHLKEILELMEPFDLNPCIYFRGNILCKRIDEKVLASIGRTGKKAIAYRDLSEMYSEPNAKIIFRMDLERMAECEAFAKQHPSPYWNVFKSGPWNLEFSDARINKAYPLSIISERTGISLENMIAFGDTSNDNEMLKAVGWGVCMKNGTEDTKQATKDVTELSNEEDGVADYIEKNILNKFGW